jgi:hypothetical protein
VMISLLAGTTRSVANEPLTRPVHLGAYLHTSRKCNATIHSLLLADSSLRAFLTGRPNDLKQWTDDTGQHSINARFIGLGERAVVLARVNGNRLTVPLTRLSKASQEQARQLSRVGGQRLRDVAVQTNTVRSS